MPKNDRQFGAPTSRFVLCAGIAVGSMLSANGASAGWPEVSGIYPHVAMFNGEGECGTGAVVPWADRSWVVTYGPHLPEGSSDKLYEIAPALERIIRPESIGGTPANRMIHRESRQLFLGPYAIGADRSVRAIACTTLFGRPTGLAQLLTGPASKIVCATMEEGISEVDAQTLNFAELRADKQRQSGCKAAPPGCHGKRFYSASGRHLYANNRSLIRMLFDSAHGWSTEWPRIRDIGEDALLMTMHGSPRTFPKTFSAVNSAGVAPRLIYLKVIGDFCRWGDHVVFGCDDTVQGGFLNKDHVKGNLAGPGKSQSNLWFVKQSHLNGFGPALGRGAVWLNDDVNARGPSEPFLFSGTSRWGDVVALLVTPDDRREHELPDASGATWSLVIASTNAVGTAQFDCP